jgi:hypothetical protein
VTRYDTIGRGYTANPEALSERSRRNGMPVQRLDQIRGA